MTEYNFSVKKGDTFNGVRFTIIVNTLFYANLAAFPVTGQTNRIYVANDTGNKYVWNGSAYVTTTNSIYLDLTGATLLCQFKPDAYSVATLSLTGGAGLTIVNAVGGQLQIDPQIINIPWGTYQYDIQITLPGGIVKTYISGTMTVTEDISNV